VRTTGLALDDPAVGRDRVKELLQTTEDDEREARDAVDQDCDRMLLLIARLERLRPSAPIWSRLHMKARMFNVSVWTCSLGGTGEKPFTDEQWDVAWEAQAQMRKEVLAMLEPMAASYRPPSRELLRRSRGRLNVRRPGRRRVGPGIEGPPESTPSKPPA